MTNKAKLMICLIALSVALAGYVSCLLASHIRWTAGLLTAPAILPGLSFGLATGGWLLHRRWISRRKAVGLAVGSAVAYFAAYWTAVYTFAFCGRGMILSTRLSLFHTGMIAGLVGATLLIASLAAISAAFRRTDWKMLILIGAAAGGALCLAGIGASSGDHAGSLANPGDRVFIFVWQLLVSGYVGMLLLAAPGSSKPAERSRIAHRAARVVFALLVASFVQAAIGYSRRDQESKVASPPTSGNSNTQPSTLASGDATAWAIKYRNAKFMTRSEFVKQVDHPELKINCGPEVRDHISDPYRIVADAAQKHGLRVGAGPARLVVDVQLNLSKISYTEDGMKTGEETIFTMPVAISLAAQGICHRGDKFAVLTVCPVSGWATRYGKMGDFGGISYEDLFRDAVNGLLDSLTKLTNADDDDDGSAWTKNLWAPAQDAAMHAAFVAAMRKEPGRLDRIFEALTSVRPTKIELEGADKQVNAQSLQERWSSEIRSAGYQVDSSAAIGISHTVAIAKAARNPLGKFLDVFEDTSFRVDTSAIQVWENNVVFDFNGELRRADVCIWSDLQSTTALPEDNDKIARELVNGRISSFAKEAGYRR